MDVKVKRRCTVLPTVAEVLELDVFRRGAPRVLAGSDRLGAPVRWVHVIELASAAHLLRGGELVLSTGIALPADSDGLSRYVSELATVGISGLAVELGSRYVRSLPSALVAAATNHNLPLIVLERETQFVAITEAVHARIIDAQLAQLRSAERLHDVFTELAVSGADADEIVARAAALAGHSMVLENLAHQVIACAPLGWDASSLLADFAARSRTARVAGRTGYDPAAGWLITMVGARGEDWGRLVMLRGDPPGPGDVTLIERAATTLALGRLLDHQRESLERLAHRTILSTLIGHGYADPSEAEARVRALGIPVTSRQLVAMVVRLAESPGSDIADGLARDARAAGVANALAEVCRDLSLPVLAGSLDDRRVAALLALPSRAEPDTVLYRIASLLRPLLDDRDVIGVGSAVDSVAAAQRSLNEADHVAQAADGTDGRAFYRLPNLRLRGLLHLLRSDPRVQAFAERELGPLMLHDAAAGTSLLATLAAYLDAGGNKAAASQRAHLARPTMYERLREIESILGVSLDDPESRLSLHVALLAIRVSSA